MKCNLKKLTTILILIVSLNICSAQELSKIVRNDFCKNAEFDSKYGNGNMKTLLGYCARNIGINTFEELVTAIENICYNYKLQEEFFKLIYTSNSNRDVLFMQFHSIGMKPENATKLTDYVLAKYDNENKVDNNTESFNTTKKTQNFDLSTDKYENETANITLRLLEDLTDLKNLNPSKVQTQLQSFNQNWRFRNDYSENGEYFFGKQNEIIKLRLKGIKNTLFYSFLDKKTFEEIKEQINTYVDLKILKTENDMDYNKKYYETLYHKIMLAEVKENEKIFGYNVMMSTK